MSVSGGQTSGCELLTMKSASDLRAGVVEMARTARSDLAGARRRERRAAKADAEGDAGAT